MEHDSSDTDGEIDAAIADTVSPFAALPDGVIMEVALAVIEEGSCSVISTRGFRSCLRVLVKEGVDR